MTITLSLPPETEKKLVERAARSGKDVNAFILEAIEEKLLDLRAGGETSAAASDTSTPRAGGTLDEVLARVLQQVEAGGRTEEELTALLTNVRDQVRREKTPLTPELRAWALQQFTEEELVAGLRELQEHGGLELSEFLSELEQIVARP